MTFRSEIVSSSGVTSILTGLTISEYHGVILAYGSKWNTRMLPLNAVAAFVAENGSTQTLYPETASKFELVYSPVQGKGFHRQGMGWEEYSEWYELFRNAGEYKVVSCLTVSKCVLCFLHTNGTIAGFFHE